MTAYVTQGLAREKGHNIPTPTKGPYFWLITCRFTKRLYKPLRSHQKESTSISFGYIQKGSYFSQLFSYSCQLHTSCASVSGPRHFYPPKSPLRISRADISTKGLVRRSLTLFVPLNPSELGIGPSRDVPKSVVKGYKRPRLALSLADVGPHERPSEPIKAPSRIVHGFSNFGDERCAGWWQLGATQSVFERDNTCVRLCDAGRRYW